MLDKRLNLHVLPAAALAVLGAGLAWWWGYPAGLVAVFVVVSVGFVALAWKGA
jgi:hypothetical protein